MMFRLSTPRACYKSQCISNCDVVLPSEPSHLASLNGRLDGTIRLMSMRARLKAAIPFKSPKFRVAERQFIPVNFAQAHYLKAG